MNVSKAKRYSPKGWKYVNADGSMWPEDRWIPFSKKHPAPESVKQIIDDASLPWSIHSEPMAPRSQCPANQWNGLEAGSQFMAIIKVVRPIAEKDPVGVQTKVTDYFQE